jgi:hypothetical protein
MYSGQSNFEFENFGKIETEFEKKLWYELGAQVDSMDEKNQSEKISCNCPFRSQNFMLIHKTANFENFSNYVNFFQ